MTVDLARMPIQREIEIAVVGGGPAGAAVAARLAAAGHEVVVFERWREPRWRACGVYSSPATARELRRLGLPRERLDALVRPLRAIEVESLRGGHCRLAYEPPDLAVGLDRVRLERALLDHAAAAGATVLEGTVVRAVDWTNGAGRGGARLTTSSDGGQTTAWRPRLLIGADGPRSLVARSAGVAGRPPLLRHGALTVHRPDPQAAPPGTPMEARMVIGDGWYCGISPVPGGRVNVGIVMTADPLQRLLRQHGGPGAVVEHIVARVPSRGETWRTQPASDAVAAALPLAYRPHRISGDAFLLVGDAAGFIDPLSGDGIHRSLVSARLAADAASQWRRGERGALEGYERRLRGRFGRKDAVSWTLQLFMHQPRLLDYAVRRLDRRAGARRTFGRALADLEPAGRLLHPRFLVSLLAP